MSEQPHSPHGHDDHGHGHGHGHGSRFIQHHYDDAKHQFDAGKLGIWIFLAQEVLFFSALFVAYILYRAHHPEIYAYAHKYLDTKMGAINTGVLILSSLTAAWAVRCAQLNQKRGLILCLSITIACALGFLGIKYVEYTHKIHEHILFGRYFDPCISSGGTPLLTKNNECPGTKSTVTWDFAGGVPKDGCLKDIDQDLATPDVQADCVVTQYKVENYAPARLSGASATHDCGKVPAAAINASNGNFTFTGSCEEIIVVGNKNTLTVDSVKKLAVKGEGNTVNANAVGAIAGQAGNAFNAKAGIGAPQPTLGAVTDADVNANKQLTRTYDPKPIQHQCPDPFAAMTGHGAGGHGEAGAKYPCWRPAYQPAVCKKDVGILVEYGDHAERGHDVLIKAECKPSPKAETPADPFAEKPATFVLGQKAASGSTAPTAHEAKERMYAGPPPENTNMFFTIYFAMTGLHGIHVLVGVGIFVWLLIRAIRGHFTPDYFGPIDFAALYWHIVDLIWIFLFPLLYLIH
ncbi:MAG: cytochrome c oxidase subunit 3 [Kofleriaceae bacterium]